jgi:hypothetical protein
LCKISKRSNLLTVIQKYRFFLKIPIMLKNLLICAIMSVFLQGTLFD